MPRQSLSSQAQKLAVPTEYKARSVNVFGPESVSVQEGPSPFPARCSSNKQQYFPTVPPGPMTSRSNQFFYAIQDRMSPGLCSQERQDHSVEGRTISRYP